MRRTDEDFKAEVFRRCEVWRERRRKQRRMVITVCLPVLLCSAALMMVFSGGFGGSATEMGFDNAMSVECKEAPAADVPAAAIEDVAPEEGSRLGDPSGCSGVVVSIEITSQPEQEEYSRVFTDTEKIYAIIDAIQAFYDDPQTTPGGSEIGECEGIVFRIVLKEEAATRTYTLFNNALSADGDEEWLVNPVCYKTLESLIQQDDA